MQKLIDQLDEFIEGVRVDTSDYIGSTGSKPKGSGTWVFSFTSPAGKRARDLDTKTYTGGYGAAVKKAKSDAAKTRSTTIYLLAHEIDGDSSLDE